MGDVRRLVEALRAAGVTVHEWSGWDGRGNEKKPQIQIKGAIIHHTGTPYGFAFAGLVSSTRPDLYGGLLCNFAGNSDGSLTVTGSGLAWHAGGGYGPNQGPLAPYANNRNFYTVGLEIVYPGSSPMTEAQYKTALIFSKVVADLFAGGDLEYVRGHYEVNGRGYSGKWDPGYKPGTNIDMNLFRSQARSVVINPDEEVKEPMFAVISLPAHPNGVLPLEQVVGLPDVGGATNITERYVHIHNANAEAVLSVAHWRLNDGSLVGMVPDGTVVPPLGRTGGILAPANAHSLVVDYNAPLGLSAVIEAK
jgi:hypothetical protein